MATSISGSRDRKKSKREPTTVMLIKTMMKPVRGVSRTWSNVADDPTRKGSSDSDTGTYREKEDSDNVTIGNCKSHTTSRNGRTESADTPTTEINQDLEWTLRPDISQVGDQDPETTAISTKNWWLSNTITPSSIDLFIRAEWTTTASRKRLKDTRHLPNEIEPSSKSVSMALKPSTSTMPINTIRSLEILSWRNLQSRTSCSRTHRLLLNIRNLAIMMRTFTNQSWRLKSKPVTRKARKSQQRSSLSWRRYLTKLSSKTCSSLLWISILSYKSKPKPKLLAPKLSRKLIKSSRTSCWMRSHHRSKCLTSLP